MHNVFLYINKENSKILLNNLIIDDVGKKYLKNKLYLVNYIIF